MIINSTKQNSSIDSDNNSDFTLFVKNFGDQIISGDSLNFYLRNCEGFERKMLFVFKPKTENSIFEFIKICEQTKTCFNPISTGHNWGYGSSLPAQTNVALVDLSLLDQIKIEEELGVVDVQPGVTPQKLFEYLKSNNSKWMTPTTGAGLHGSIVGNALERGFGLNPIIDHFESVLGIRAVFADGTIYESRLADMGAFHSDQVSKWKVGPSMEGLFSQSNFGLILSLKIQLAPIPIHVDFLIIKGNLDQIPKAVELCQELRLKFSGNMGGINFSNRERIESTLGLVQSTPAANLITQILGIKLTEFQVLLPIFISDPIYKNISPKIKKIAKAYGFKPTLITEKFLNTINSLKTILSFSFLEKFWNMFENLVHFSKLLKGMPTDFTLKIAYTHTPEKNKTNNPAQDEIGILWFAPILRLKKEDFDTVIQILENVLPRFGQKNMWTFMIFNQCLVEATIPIYFDSKNEVEKIKAQQCWDELFNECLKKGFAPYRYSIERMNYCEYKNPKLKSLQSRMKQLFDPNELVSPGRYLSN